MVSGTDVAGGFRPSSHGFLGNASRSPLLLLTRTSASLSPRGGAGDTLSAPRDHGSPHPSSRSSGSDLPRATWPRSVPPADPGLEARPPLVCAPSYARDPLAVGLGLSGGSQAIAALFPIHLLARTLCRLGSRSVDCLSGLRNKSGRDTLYLKMLVSKVVLI